MSPLKRLQRAFTLIEMLVVLVIMAIITTIAVLVFSGQANARELYTAGQELVNMTKAASAQSVITQKTLGVRFNKHGYQLYKRVFNYPEPGAWTLIKDSALSRKNAFHSGVLVTIQYKNPNDPAKKSKNPQLIFYPNGLVSPLVFQITNQHSKPIYLLKILLGGETQLGLSS
jgi:general secretion pathway protein H